MSNINLNKARVMCNDEFYTRFEDVEKELSHYTDHFKNKVVYCNCDNPEKSAFWKYFHLNFTSLGLKKLISTYYDNGRLTYKTEYSGGSDDDIITGIKSPLDEDGDFYSRECLDILCSSDIIVTNPPFSIFRIYLSVLIEYHKKFLIVAPKNAVTYKEIFPLIKNGVMWTGYNSVNSFVQPDGTLKKFGNLVGWFTNLDISKNHDKIVLCKKYDSVKYPKYDNYDAIEVSKSSDIPMDYAGVMGVPITWIDKFNPDEIEIIGATESEGKGFSCGLWNADSKVVQPLISGNKVYKRIFIKNRNPISKKDDK